MLLLAFLLVSCGENGQKSYYIEEPVRGAVKESPAVKTPQIYYFFDRTLSMQGFVNKKDSEYSRCIPRLWEVAESSALWPETETKASFYKFTEGRIYKVSKNHVSRNVLRPEFYKMPDEGSLVSAPGDDQVFATVAKYIARVIASEPSPDKLFIVVNDLYEQNRQDNSYNAFFRNAFENGLSGAIIAVQSEFDGKIENITRDTADEGIEIKGKSTFFIFIIGPRDTLLQYCGVLFDDTDFRSLKSERVFFLLGDESLPSDLPRTPDVKFAESDEDFKRIANNNNINLRANIPTLFTADGNPVNRKVAAFQLLNNVGSRYVGGLAAKNLAITNLPVKDIESDTFKNIFKNNFKNNFQFDDDTEKTVEFSGGEEKTEDNLSVFEPVTDKEESSFTVTAAADSAVNEMDEGRYPLAVVINTKNGSLREGCYRINYELFQRAKIPDWVTARNAETADKLKESIKPNEPVKILKLESIYKNITEAYNKQREWRRVYSDTIYLEKLR